MITDTLAIALRVEDGQLTAGFGRALRSLSSFVNTGTAQLGKMAKVFESIGNSRWSQGTVAAVAAVALALGASLRPAIEFETAFTGVLKTVDGSSAQLGKLRTDILDMASAMPVAASEVARVAETAGQLGVAAGSVAEFTETMIKVGTATNLSAEQAATAFAQLANVMQIPLGDIDNLAAALVDLGNNSATTEAQILGMAQRIGGAAAILGLSGDEVLGIAAAVASTGIEVEAGGSAISRVFIDMAKAAELGGENLAVFAETAGYTAEAFQDLVSNDAGTAFVAFVEGLAELEASGGSALQTLEQLGLDGIRVGRVLLNLSGSSDLLARSLRISAEAAKENTALTAEYERFISTTSAAIDIFRGKIENLAIAFGTLALPAITDGFRAAGEAIEFMSETLGPAASEIVEFLGTIISLFGELATVVGGPALAGAAAVLIGVSTALEGIFSILNALGPAGAVLAIIAADIALVGPASVAAASGLAALKASIAATGLASTVAVAGIKAIKVALASGPWIVAAGAIALLGKSYLDAKRDAEAFATALSGNLNTALESGNYEQFSRDLQNARADLNALGNDAGAFSQSSSTFGRAFDAIKISAVGAYQAISVGENTVANTQARWEALNSELERSQFGAVQLNAEQLANSLGITESSVVGFAQQLGLMDLLLDTSEASFYELRAAIEAHTAELAAAGEAAGVSAGDFLRLMDIIAAGNATIGDVADVLGVTTDTVARFGEESGVAADDLLGMALATSGALAELQPYAESLGITATKAADAKTEILGLVSAVGAFNDVLSGVEDRQSALEQVIGATAAAAEAQARYNEAINEGDFEGAARAMEDYLTNLILSGTSAEEAGRRQENMAADFIRAGEAAGESRAELENLLIVHGRLTDVEMIELEIQGKEALIDTAAAAAEARLELEDLTGREFIARLAAELGTTEEDIARAIASGELWDNSTFTSVYEAIVEAEEAEDTLALLAAQDGLVYDSTVDVGLSGVGVDDLEALKRAIDAIQNKSVTVSVGVTGAGGYGSYDVGSFQEDGGIVQSYAAGGIAGPIREAPGRAKIYKPASKYRVFAEPQTGGEAYIPLARAKRPRSLQVWRETGRKLGVSGFADGGISGGDVQSYAGGGINSKVFSGSGGFPAVEVAVTVDTESLGVMHAPLGELESRIAGVTNAFGEVTKSTVGTQAALDNVTKSGQDTDAALSDVSKSTEGVDSGLSNITKSTVGVVAGLTAAAKSSTVFETDYSRLLAYMSDETPAATVRMVDAFADMGVQFGDIAVETGEKIAESLFDGDEFLTRVSEVKGITIEELKAIGEEGATVGEQLAEDWDGSITELVGILERAGLDLGDVFLDVFTESADAVEIFEGAIESAADELDRFDDSADVLRDVMDTLYGSFLDVVEAQNDVTSATERLERELEELGEEGGRTDANLASFVDTLIRTGEKYVDLAVAQARAGEGQDAVNATLAEGERAFRAAAEAAGLDSEMVDKLAEALFALPPEVVTDLVVQGEEAQATIETTKDAAETYRDGEYVATIGADNGPAIRTIEDARLAAEGFAVNYDGNLTVTNGPAITAIEEAELYANRYANGIYDGELTASNDQAETVINTTESSALDYAGGSPYNADLTASDNASGTISGPQGAADEFEDSYNATLSATDNASGTINNINNALRNFNSKTVTLTTVQRTVYQEDYSRVAIPSAGGNFFRSFAGGGIGGGGDRANAHAPEFASNPRGPGRLWLEPETGGESYIPHRNDWRRPRALAVLEQTWRLFGRPQLGGAHGFAAGGVRGLGRAMPRGIAAGQIAAPPSITIDITNHLEVPAGANAEYFQAMADSSSRTVVDELKRELTRATDTRRIY